MIKKLITKNAGETEAAGEWLSRRLKGGEVVCLSGDLGGGKTTFIKGLARGLGVEQAITSPTFLVEAVYKVKSQKSKVKNIYHLDVYRVKSSAEILALGWEEVLADPSGVVFIEWAERVADILPEKCIWVRFKFIDADTREIEIRY